MARSRVLIAVAAVTLCVSLVLVARSVRMLVSGRLPASTPAPLAGRLGDTVAGFDTHFHRAGVQTVLHAAPSPPPGGPYREVYDVPEGRLVADVLPGGRIRQMTISRLRTVQDTWEPEPGDWTLAQAQEIARRWLPADATPRGHGTFQFQEREAGVRETFFSGALASVFGNQSYADARVGGPPGTCAISYYQTRDGGVAFLLIGIA